MRVYIESITIATHWFSDTYINILCYLPIPRVTSLYNIIIITAQIVNESFASKLDTKVVHTWYTVE